MAEEAGSDEGDTVVVDDVEDSQAARSKAQDPRSTNANG